MGRKLPWIIGGLAGLGLLLALTAVFLIGRKKRSNLTGVGTETREEEGPPGDKEMSFWEHLEELRERILRSLFYILLGTVVAWFHYETILHWVIRPVEQVFKELDIPPLVFSGIAEPLLLRFQISIAAGIVLAFPLVLYEILAFIWPALYPNEKRFALKLLPMALLLFGIGATFVYLLLPTVVRFLVGFIPQTIASLLLNFGRQYVWMVVKISVAMGLAFQMPLIFMFLGRLGIVSAKTLLRYWRHAVLAIFTFSAIVTPTWDPFNMTLWALPLLALYFLSVALVALTQRAQRKEEVEV